MELICRKLWLKPGETVVEAGCGWGALALYMARHYGVTVKAYNVSREQIRTARERAKAEGLEARVEFIEDDYRTIRGQFDVFASIGMLEHVGAEPLSPVGRSDPSLPAARRPGHRAHDRPRLPGLPERLDRAADLSRRLCAESARDHGRAWNRDRSRCWTWRICGCTTP